MLDTHKQKVYLRHMTELKDYIKNLRKKLNLTQEGFAELIGKDRTTVARYESGDVIPPGNVLLEIQALNPNQAQSHTDLG